MMSFYFKEDFLIYNLDILMTLSKKFKGGGKNGNLFHIMTSKYF